MLPILQETPHWIAINKAAGLIVERNPYESPTIEELVWEQLSTTQKKPFLGIIHRLDRVTSGVLLLAKKKSALQVLNQQFSQRQIRKSYLAIVTTAPAKASDTLQHWLEKDQMNKRAIIHTEAHKKAITCRLSYRTIGQNKWGTILEVLPKTGKFHQIRAQLASIGCPIVGDKKYGSTLTYLPQSVALHAWKLRFYDPSTQEQQEICATPPWEQA